MAEKDKIKIGQNFWWEDEVVRKGGKKGKEAKSAKSMKTACGVTQPTFYQRHRLKGVRCREEAYLALF